MNDKGLWECPPGKPNHLWDCAVLILVAAEVRGLKYRRKPEPAEEAAAAQQEERKVARGGRW